MNLDSKNKRVGLLLAGGAGTRLRPLTQVINKHLLAVFDKPMIYYSLSLIMLAGIREVVVITSEQHLPTFKSLLGNGNQWGIEIHYIIQRQPEGLPQAYTLSKDIIKDRRTMLVLGDNILVGDGLADILRRRSESEQNFILACKVADPENYGVLIESAGKISLHEKPTNLKIGYAIPGIYFLDEMAPEKAKLLSKSKRGEFEIIDLLAAYNDIHELHYEKLGRGYAWLDAGSHERLLDASNYVAILQRRQNILIGSPDEIALRNGWINTAILQRNIESYGSSSYGNILKVLLHEMTTPNTN